MSNAKLVRTNWVLGALILVPVLADLIATRVPPSSFWFQFLPNLYYAGIVVAGIEFGWKAGLGFAGFAALFHGTVDSLTGAGTSVQLEASAIAFLLVGFAFLEQRKSATGKAAATNPVHIPEGPDCVSQVAEISAEMLREVRTPFASIEGAAYILEESGPDLENQKEFVEIIRCESRRVNRILAEVEECTEVIPLKCAATSASSLLAEVIRLSALGHPDPAISLRMDVAQDLPPLWCDPERIQQTLVPFVTSAMSGMPSGGEIQLSAARDGAQARIQLRILGQTIHGTDPLTGQGQYSSTFEAGSGVRVLAARRTVLQHGGTISIEQIGHIKRLSSVTLPLYTGQIP